MGGEKIIRLLSDWLGSQTDADRVEFIEPPMLLPGGAVQQNWALDVTFSGGRLPGRQHLVLRANFQTPLPASQPKAQEFAVLQAVAAAGVSVPEPLWLCEDARVIGQPFFLMRWLPGDASAQNLITAAVREGFGPALAGRLARELAWVHAQLPGDPRLAWLGLPSASSALVQVAQCRDWLTALEPTSSILPAALDWLESHVPLQDETCLVHRDFRSGNFLVDDGRLTAILDWEFAGWGDRHEDIGWFCAACWRAGSDLEAGGLATRGEFYRAYEAADGTSVDADTVSYWEVMAHVRWTMIARQQGMRAEQGDAPQHELLEAAARAPGLERDIATMIAA